MVDTQNNAQGLNKEELKDKLQEFLDSLDYSRNTLEYIDSSLFEEDRVKRVFYSCLSAISLNDKIVHFNEEQIEDFKQKTLGVLNTTLDIFKNKSEIQAALLTSSFIMVSRTLTLDFMVKTSILVWLDFNLNG